MTPPMGTGYECQRPPLTERALREGILSARRHPAGTCWACDELRRIDAILPSVIAPRIVYPTTFTTTPTV